MSQTNDGGPAFPRAAGPVDEYMVGGHKMSHPEWEAAPGMSLRDWFAGQAMQGVIAAVWEDVGVEPTEQEIKIIAASAFKFADAMLAARGGAK